MVPPRNPQHSSSPLFEQVTAELEGAISDGDPTLEAEPTTLPPAAGVLQSPDRPALWHIKSDSILLRQSLGTALSTSPTSIHGLSPPAESIKSASRSPPEYSRPRNGHRSDSSSSYQISEDSNAGSATRSRRHISFNSFVEQRVVVDPQPPPRLSTVYARSSSDSGSEDEDDTILQMRSSSGSSLSSSRRGSSNSQVSSSDIVSNRPATQMTMITAPIAPTLLKLDKVGEPDNLPVQSPAIVFVAPHGVDEEALKYEVHIASKPHFAVQADRRRIGGNNWSPRASGEEQQQEPLDYFSGVPLNGEPIETPRESIYTEEDEDAITVRPRGVRSPRLNGRSRGDPMSPNADESELSPIAPETARLYPVVPGKNSFARKPPQTTLNSSSPPTVSHDEVARPSAGDEAPRSSRTILPKPLGVPRHSGSHSDIQPGAGSSGGSGPRSSILSASMSSMRSGRSSARNRNSSAITFEGVDMGGHTSALSGRAGADTTSARADDRSDSRGRSQRGQQDDMERPRRGRSLLRTSSSSTVSERERSSTTGSSSSPMGSLSPRSTTSVGIVGGYIVPPSGIGSIIVPSGSLTRNGSSGLRHESGWSGSWSAEEEQNGIDGGDLAQVSPTKTKPPSSGGLVRVSSSSNLSQTSTQSTPRSSGIRRTNSSTNVAAKSFTTSIQRTTLSSNAPPSTPPLTTPLITNVPVVTLQPPSSQGTTFDELRHANEGLIGTPSSGASYSSESTGSSWKAREFDDSPITPPPLVELEPKPVAFAEPSLQRELVLTQNSIKPRASGMSLASTTSNGSNESNATVVPKSSRSAKQRSSQLASASSSVSPISPSTSPTPHQHQHRRSSSKSSLNSGAPSPPLAVRSSGASSGSTPSVTQAVATRSGFGSPVPSATRMHLRQLSGGMPSPTGGSHRDRDKSPSSFSSSPVVSPGSVLSNVVESAKGFFDALWSGGEPRSG